MNEQTQSIRWNTRGFISFFLTMQFLLLALSGFLLYAAPRCRDAAWAGWQFWSFSKEQWESLHLFLGILFPLTALIHLAYNWSMLIGYLRKRSQMIQFQFREFAAAIGLMLILIILAAKDNFPVNALVEHGEAIKETYAAAITPPPWNGAEEATLSALTKDIGLSLPTALSRLKDAGHPVMESDTLAILAERDGISAMKLYEIMLGPEAKEPSVVRHGDGRCGSGKRRSKKCETHDAEHQSTSQPVLHKN